MGVGGGILEGLKKGGGYSRVRDLGFFVFFGGASALWRPLS